MQVTGAEEHHVFQDMMWMATRSTAAKRGLWNGGQQGCHGMSVLVAVTTGQGNDTHMVLGTHRADFRN